MKRFNNFNLNEKLKTGDKILDYLDSIDSEMSDALSAIKSSQKNLDKIRKFINKFEYLIIPISNVTFHENSATHYIEIEPKSSEDQEIMQTYLSSNKINYHLSKRYSGNIVLEIPLGYKRY